MCLRRPLLLLPLCLISVCAAASSPALFQETELPPLPGHLESRPYGLNEFGTVAGVSLDTQRLTHAVLWRNGQPVPLPELPGDVASEARGIGNGALAFGYSQSADFRFRGVVWENGLVRPLPPLPLQESGFATSVDRSGQIAGQSGSHAVLWNSTGVRDLGVPPGFSRSTAHIAPAGEVYVDAYRLDGTGALYQWRGGRLRPLGVKLGLSASLGPIASRRALLIMHWDTPDGPFHAALRTPSGTRELPSLPGDRDVFADAMNERGQIVGTSGTNGGHFKLVQWQHGKIQELERLVPEAGPVRFVEPTGINNAGQICGRGWATDHVSGVLLTP